jgi:nicotinamidase-related amidase
MSMLPDNTALIIIDVQQGFFDPTWGRRNNPHAEDNITTLLERWRQAGRPIFHIQHLSLLPDSPLSAGAAGSAFQDCVQPLSGEPVIQKHVNSAFIGTNLEERLRQSHIDNLVIVGLTTDHCVSTTTRMAGNLGFQTFVVADATATFDREGHDGKHYPAEDIHAIALASLHHEFATVVDMNTLLSHIY